MTTLPKCTNASRWITTPSTTLQPRTAQFARRPRNDTQPTQPMPVVTMHQLVFGGGK